ncbi:MAG: CBS domain-containing protein [Clostridia bacterium]|nr:CBS domain-containing protein [Clostridia bacterium]
MNVLLLLTPKSEVKYIRETSTIRSALEKMKIHGYTAIPVITAEGFYAGSVSEGDFLWYFLEKKKAGETVPENARVKDLIRPGYNPAVTADADRNTLIERAENQNFIPVTDDRGTFIGIVTRKTIIEKLCTPTQTRREEGIPAGSPQYLRKTDPAIHGQKTS